MTGVVILILLMAIAYTGYVLPWGQMSYWATKVIISFVTVIPFVREFGSMDSRRLYGIRCCIISVLCISWVLLPLIIIALIGIHIIAYMLLDQ